MDKKKFGVYFEDELIDTIEAENQEEAEDIVLKEVEEIPSQLKYRGKILYEDDNVSDEVDNAYFDDFRIKPLKEK